MNENNPEKYDSNSSQGGSGGSDRGNSNRGNGSGNGRDPRKQSIIMMIVVAVLYIFLFSVLMNVIGGKSEEEISYSKFISMLEAGEIESVEIDTDRIYITAVDNEHKSVRDQAVSIFFYMPTGGRSSVRYFTGKVEEDDTLTARLLDAGVEVQGKVVNVGTMILSFFMSYVFPLLLMWGLFSLLFRRLGRSGGGIFNVGKSNAKVYVQKETGVTFKDVAGEDEAKESLVEVVDFLHNPDKYSKIGAKLPKGALLVGPPGTGKTLLAKAVAGEAHVPFFSLSGSDFIELYVGVGASRVRDLFKEATKNAPCIIFIDEIDAIGRSRDSKYGGGNEEREQTLNQLLSEMDGFDTSKGILVLGATNRPEILDKALLRPGRFDRRIIVDKPDLKGRVEILKVHAKDVNLDETVDLDEIALATSGAVGADLANMINEGAIMAVQNGRSSVSQKDLFAAVEQVLVGKEKKDRIMSKKEREIVSYHEVGHALISALQKNSEPIQKITIVPRTMGALGYVMNVPEEEKYLETKAELHDRLVSLLGGRAAEEIVFGDVTTGAANDIEKATSIAQNMVTRFGMSERFGLMGLATIESQYLDGSARYTCSDRTVADIDSEIMAILRQCYEEAKTMLSENRDVMEQLAKHLIEKETISGKEFMKIFREIKGLPEPEEEAEDAATKKTDGGAPDQGGAGIAGYDRYVTDSTANSEQMKTRERIGEAIRNGGEDHAEGQESYLGRNVDVTVDGTSGETPGNAGIAGQTFTQPVPSNAGTEGQTPVQDVPQNTKDTSAEEKPRWTPPSPGPDRDREGAPRGRFSDTPFDSL